MVFVEFDNSGGSGSFIGDVTSFTAERTFVVVYHLDWVVEFSERFNSQKNDEIPRSVPENAIQRHLTK